MTILDDVHIAEVAHEANRELRFTLGEEDGPSWGECDQEIRASVIAGVAYLRQFPDAGPVHSHNSWLKCRRQSGWAWGLEKSVAAKTHPCLVAYDQLSPQQRLKDALFVAVVRALLGE